MCTLDFNLGIKTFNCGLTLVIYNTSPMLPEESYYFILRTACANLIESLISTESLNEALAAKTTSFKIFFIVTPIQ